jgi:hypothetical protein
MEAVLNAAVTTPSTYTVACLQCPTPHNIINRPTTSWSVFPDVEIPESLRPNHLDTVVFHSNRQSRVTHPPVDSEIWQGSRITPAIVEPP